MARPLRTLSRVDRLKELRCVAATRPACGSDEWRRVPVGGQRDEPVVLAQFSSQFSSNGGGSRSRPAQRTSRANAEKEVHLPFLRVSAYALLVFTLFFVAWVGFQGFFPPRFSNFGFQSCAEEQERQQSRAVVTRITIATGVSIQRSQSIISLFLIDYAS